MEKRIKSEKRARIELAGTAPSPADPENGCRPHPDPQRVVRGRHGQEEEDKKRKLEKGKNGRTQVNRMGRRWDGGN